MSVRRRSPGERIALLVYLCALRTLPRRVRASTSDDMVVTFMRLARRWRRRGATWLLVGTVAESWDVVVAGLRSRVPGSMPAAAPAPAGASVAVSVLEQATRRLVRRPAYALAFIGTLGLGLGVAAAMFALVSAVSLRPPPFRDAERLVYVWSVDVTSGSAAEMPGADASSLLAWRDVLPVLDGFEAYQRAPDRVITGGGDPEQLSAAYVTPGLFAFLGVDAILGRRFAADEGHVGGARVVVISHGLWSRRFGRDPEVVGRTLELNGEPHVIIGVMARGFSFPEEAEAWLPVAWAADALSVARGGEAIARLRPGVGIDAANERLAALSARDPALAPTGRGPLIVPPFYLTTNDRTKMQLVVFFGAVLLVLAIALANVISLGLAGAVGRGRELAIQAALGAGRGRLVLQLVAEATILSLLGAMLGLALANGLLRGLLPVVESVLRINTGGRVPAVWPDGLLFTVAAVAVAGPLVGLLTAAFARVGLAATVLNSRSNTDERRSVRMQKALIVTEVALALVLVSGAGLLLGSFVRLMQRDAGFDVDRLVAVTLRLPEERYPDAEQRATFFRRVEEAFRALPGVTGVVATATDFPRSGARFQPELRAEGGDSLTLPRAFLPQVTVGPGFHEVVGTRITLGRGFVRGDAGTPVTIVNETLAHRLWPSGSPVGRRLRITEREGWLTVVGVAADAVQMGLRDGWGEGMEVYAPLDPAEAPSTRSFVLRTEASAGALLDPVRAAVWSIDPLQPLEQVRTVRAALGESIARERFYLGLLAGFAVLATLLAAIGLHAVMSQVVARRTREIGIRVALGARAVDVIRSAVGVAAVLVIGGLAVGTIAALALTRFLRGLLFGVEPGDPLMLAGNVLVLLVVAFAACLLPTRRALAVDPVRALSAE